MSDLRIVKGNDFATLYTIRAMYADGTIVEDFDLRACTDVQVIVHRTYSKSVASLLSANEYGSYSLEPENVLRINWDGLLVKLGTYTVDFRAKFRGADIRSYSIKDLIFDIVETNEEANIPAGAFVDYGVYVFSGDFVLMFESQVQADWDESDTSSPAYIKNKPTIPSSLAELSEDAEHRTVTDAEIAEWNAKQDAIADIDEIRSGAAAGATAYQLPATGIPKAELSEQVQASLAKADTAYQKPSTGIPASDIASGVIPDVSQFITRNVNDLVNYYLKSETYSKAEVQGLIAAINQFHYEIYPSTSAVTNPQGNVLYLIGPTGTGADKYEEYVYANNTWVKIGDTSIDLSGYVTTQALNAALANYTTTANLNTLLAGKQDVLTFDNVPTDGSTNPVTSDGLHDVFEQIYEDYAKKDGFYENMLVGSALNLTDTTGAYIAREFYYSPAGGTNDIKTGSAFIKRIKGSTIVWNQLVQNNVNIQFDYTNTTSSLTYPVVSNGNLILTVPNTTTHTFYYFGYLKFTSENTRPTYWLTNQSWGNRSLNINEPTKTIFTGKTLEQCNSQLHFLGVPAGVRLTGSVTVSLIDLTLMFGAGNEPATVAEFEALFPLDYYDYNAGQLLSFTGDDIKTTGFNQLNVFRGTEYRTNTDPENGASAYLNENNIIIGYSADGYIRNATISSYSITGDTIKVKTSDLSYSASYGISFPVRVIGGISYYLNFEKSISSAIASLTYCDISGNIISYVGTISEPNAFNIPNNAAWAIVTIKAGAVNTEATFTNVCLNISHNGTKNGTYEEYEQHTKDISFYKSIKDGQGNPLFPYGLLSAGSVYDEVTATKAIKRIGAVDMGSLNWKISVGLFECRYNSLVPNFAKSGSVNFVTPKYTTITTYIQSQSQAVNASDKSIMVNYGSGAWQIYSIVVKDTSYTSAADFKTAMNGVMLYYELAEPIVVDITEQNMAYLVNDWGTEQLLPENTSAPVTTPAMLHVIYGMNAVDTLRNLPKNFLAQADLDRLLTAMGSVLGFTYTKSWSVDTQQWSFTITPVSTSLSLMQSVNDEPVIDEPVDEYVEEGE